MPISGTSKGRVVIPPCLLPRRNAQIFLSRNSYPVYLCGRKFGIMMDMDLQGLEKDSLLVMNDVGAAISHEQLLSNREGSLKLCSH